MDFGTNKITAQVFREGAFAGSYFREIHSGVNGKWYRNSWGEFKDLYGTESHCYSSNYYHVKINKYGVKIETTLKFLKSKGWIDSIDSYGCFHRNFKYWLDEGSYDNERQIARQKSIVGRFKNTLKAQFQ